jgi:hypothetical protein
VIRSCCRPLPSGTSKHTETWVTYGILPDTDAQHRSQSCPVGSSKQQTHQRRPVARYSNYLRCRHILDEMECSAKTGCASETLTVKLLNSDLSFLSKPIGRPLLLIKTNKILHSTAVHVLQLLSQLQPCPRLSRRRDNALHRLVTFVMHEA